MSRKLKSGNSRRRIVERNGRGLINKLIDKLPVELHIPGYQFCGPGTKLAKRLARGDRGVNKLDEACKKHDIVYDATSDLVTRHAADRELYKTAKERLLSKDASVGEKVSSAAVAAAMKGKTVLGMGVVKRRWKAKAKRLAYKKGKKRGGQLSFQNAIKIARQALARSGAKTLFQKAKLAHKALRNLRRNIREPRGRIIKIPKTGGFLPLIPLFAALGALGSLGGGAAAIAKAVTGAKSARDQLQEAERHNRVMEAKAVGSGFYIKPYKQGCGLYLSSHAKN